jgi:hypothetical protein
MRTAALALAVLLASCTSEEEPSCPGTPLARLAFGGALASGPLEAGLDPQPDLTTCSFDPGFPGSIAFTAALAADPEGTAAALCASSIYFGTRAGARWRVESTSDGAVLGACGPTCLARSRTILTGDVGPDPSAPVEFRGGLVEQLTPITECGECTIPCAARYTLVAAPGAQ